MPAYISTVTREARKAAGLTLEQAAKRIGLAPRTLDRIERNGTPDYDRALLIARIYGCRVEDVIDGARRSRLTARCGEKREAAPQRATPRKTAPVEGEK